MFLRASSPGKFFEVRPVFAVAYDVQRPVGVLFAYFCPNAQKGGQRVCLHMSDGLQTAPLSFSRSLQAA